MLERTVLGTTKSVMPLPAVLGNLSIVVRYTMQMGLVLILHGVTIFFGVLEIAERTSGSSHPQSGAHFRQARFDMTGDLGEGCSLEDADVYSAVECVLKNTFCSPYPGNGRKEGICHCDYTKTPPFTLSRARSHCALDPNTPMSKTVCTDDADCEEYENTECSKSSGKGEPRRCVCKANMELNPPEKSLPGCSVVDCTKRPSYCQKKDPLSMCIRATSSSPPVCGCRPGTELNNGTARCEGPFICLVVLSL
ncbi:hypothetical protein RvY_15096 [Ramazzottius varieornatus]|uniref:Uncharacterized protein n=1 Tax=Ramazzottius varieornatus TaxID=947166 RepID=A0A1D1W1W7_RAMVA|nr:hypothetical protein RvY_15096 [Ramazzottius varieornatus]